MAKLAKNVAKAAATADSGRDLLPEGTYEMRLRNVDTTKVGKSSNQPYWVWEFEITEDCKIRPDEAEGMNLDKRRQWMNTSLSEAALWKVKEVFDAFGYDTDADTDDMVGDHCLVVVSQRPIGAGPRQGEITNQIENVLPLRDSADDDTAEPNF